MENMAYSFFEVLSALPQLYLSKTSSQLRHRRGGERAFFYFCSKNWDLAQAGKSWRSSVPVLSPDLTKMTLLKLEVRKFSKIPKFAVFFKACDGLEISNIYKTGQISYLQKKMWLEEVN